MLSKIFLPAVSLALNVAAKPSQRRAVTTTLPSAPTSTSLDTAYTIAAGESFTPDQDYTLFDRGSGACEGQTEEGDSAAVFILEEGATLNNVIIGADQAEGVHCLGSCTLNNVWFEDVCEDAITIKQESGTSFINGGGAFAADDKVVQHNGGGTVKIDSFYVEDFGKLYRSCGNCDTQYQRSVEISNTYAVDGSYLVGINTNYGDTATITSLTVGNVKVICEKYEGTDNNDEEPVAIGDGADGTNCIYDESDITEI